MDKPKEVQFLMRFYDHLKKRNPQLSDKELHLLFFKNVNMLLEEDDISEKSAEMVFELYDIKITRSKSSGRSTSNTGSSTSYKPELDPCSRYSGARSGGC